VDVWVEGMSGSANVFTLSVGGVVVASATDSGPHVTLAWDTTRTPNGPRILTAQVRDAANNGGQDTRAVTVQNGAIHLTLGNKIHAALAGKIVSMRPAVVPGETLVPIAWVCGHASAPAPMTLLGADRTDVDVRLLPFECKAGP